jgi:hypothetical protein
MRKISYKSGNSKNFQIYIDIGYCESDYYLLNFYLPNSSETKSGKIYFKNYSSWFENFKKETLITKMMILRFYISEYMGWSLSENNVRHEYFQELYGIETANIIKENLSFFEIFIEKWFEPQSSIFKGLDFTSDDIEDFIINSIEDEQGFVIEIQFDDGSAINFLDNNQNYDSYFVLESEYEGLMQELELIVEKFNIID